MKRVSSFSRWQGRNAKTQLGQADRRQVKCFDNLRIYPIQYTPITGEFQWL